MRGNSIRTPILAAVLTGVVLVVGLLVAYLVWQRPPGQISAKDASTNVLLLGIEQTANAVRSDALIVVSAAPDEDLVLLFLPDDLTVKLDDGSFTEVGAVYDARGADGTREAVGALLGIDLPFYVAADDFALDQVMSATGDLVLTVEALVVYVDDSTEPATQIDIRPGEQTLDADGALAYLRGESEERRIVRQQQMARGLIEKGFDQRDRASVKAMVRDIYPTLETNLSISRLTDIATLLCEADPDRLQMTIVPAKEIVTDGVVRLQPQIVETERIVASFISDLELLTPSEVRVAVFNGNGVRLMARQVADYLRERGFQITRVANAETFAYSTSYIVVLTDEAKAWILRDAVPSPMKIVFPDAFEPHYQALRDYIPIETDLLLIAGEGMELE